MANKIVREIIHAKGIDIGIYMKDFENEYNFVDRYCKT